MKKMDFTYLYNRQSVPYTIWSTAGSSPIKTIIFLGTVQVERLPALVAETCPPNTIIVQGAPHWFAKDDGSDIPEYMFGFTKSAFTAILEHFAIDKVRILAESQAVPGAVGLFSLDAYSPYLKKMVLLQPLGFNSTAFEGSDAARIKVFRNRIISNARHQLIPLILDNRLRYNHRLMNQKANPRTAKARAQYNSGLMHDAIHDLQRLHEINKSIVIICGTNDKLFPPHEIAANLAKHKITVEIRSVRGVPHSPLATKYGQKLLKKAFEYLGV